MNTKRFFLMLLLVYTVPFSMQGGWIENKKDSTTIHLKLAKLPDPTWNNPSNIADCKVVNAFLKKFPTKFAQKYREKYESNPQKYSKLKWSNINIKLHKFSGLQLEGDALSSGPLMAIAGGVSPDVIYVNFSQSDTYIQQGFLYPLDKKEDGYFSDMSKDEIAYRIHPKIWPVVYRMRNTEKNKNIWTVPYGGILAKVILYRKDLLKKAKIAYPTKDWNWNDFLDACKKISNLDKGYYGFLLQQGMPEAYRFNDFIWSAGGKVIQYFPREKQWQAVFDTQQVAEALAFYTKLTSEKWRDRFGNVRWGYTYKDASNGYHKWKLGKVGFCSEYLDGKLFASINPDLVGIITVPKGPTGISSAQLNSKMLGIFAGVKNPIIRDAAWEYLKFISSKEADCIRTKVLVENGMGHFINPAYLKMFGYKDLLRLAPKGINETFQTAIKNGQPEPYGKNCQMVYKFILQPIQQAQQIRAAEELPKNKNEIQKIMLNILKSSAQKANEQMLGIIPKKEMFKRRIFAIFILVIMAAAFSVLFSRVYRAFTPSSQAKNEKGKWQFRRYKMAYTCLMPSILLILLWKYLPLLMGAKMAFQDYEIMGNSSWVGVDNFANLLWDKEWWEAIWNSMRYSFMIICMTFLPPVILAVVLQEIPKGKLLFRTIFYLPAVISGLVVVFLWKSFYEPNQYGILNSIIMKIPAIIYILIGLVIFYILYAFFRRLYIHEYYKTGTLCLFVGILFMAGLFKFLMPVLNMEGVPWYKALFMTFDEPTRWLEDPKTAMLCCVLPMVWAGIGPGCLIYLAALKGIANDFYEAADIDGATFIDKIMFIVFPMLKPLLIIQFVGIFIAAWNNSAYILAMTGGTSKTTVAGLHIFYKAYMFLKFGPATAMAWVLGAILIGFTVNQLKVLSKIEFKTTGRK